MDTVPDALPLDTTVVPLVPAGLPMISPLLGGDVAAPVLPPVVEPLAPASKP